jgi:DNA repair protein RadC
MYQHKIDELRFSDLLSKYTRISKTKIDKFLKENPINNIFDHPTSLGATAEQLNKLNGLKEMFNLYETIKTTGQGQYLLNNATDAGNYFKALFGNKKDKELFMCTFLDTKCNVIATKVISAGTVNQAYVFPRELVKEALMYDSPSVMVAHNHPGGSLQPSNEDINLTSRLYNALKTVNVNLLDHFIVTKDSYYSFLEHGQFSNIKSNSNTIYESICQQYGASYPAIKHISANTACYLDTLNQNAGKLLSVDEVRDMYTVAGKKLEASGTDQDKDAFDMLKDVVDDLRRAQLHQKNEQVAEGGIKKSIDMDMVK